MSETLKSNSWSKSASSPAGVSPGQQGNHRSQVEWNLRSLPASAPAFDEALTGPTVRLLTVFAKHKMFALVCGLLLIAGSAYCLAAPAGSTLAGLPAEYCSIGLAAAAILLALLTTLGAWLQPLESVEHAVEVLGVPVVALERGGTPDVR